MQRKYAFPAEPLSNRYAGALRDFSNQLPVKSPSTLNRNTQRRYGAPALLPLWSKTDSNKYNNCELRKSNRSIQKLKTEGWCDYVIFLITKIKFNKRFEIIKYNQGYNIHMYN